MWRRCVDKRQGRRTIIKLDFLKCHFSWWLTGLYSGKGTLSRNNPEMRTPSSHAPLGSRLERLYCRDVYYGCVCCWCSTTTADWMSGCPVTHEKLLFHLYLASTHATWPDDLSHVQTTPRPPALLHPLVTGPAHVHSHAVYTLHSNTTVYTWLFCGGRVA